MDADQSDLIDRAIQLQDSVPVSIVPDVGQKIGEVVVAIAAIWMMSLSNSKSKISSRPLFRANRN